MAPSLKLAPHDGSWSARFEAEAEHVRAALGAMPLRIEHVGNTAVPGLAGKPVLDVAVAVSSDAAASACIAPLQALGYEYRGPHGDDPRRRYYVRDKRGARAVQLHLYVLPAPAWDAKLAFRDALRADPSLATAYAMEKYRVADAVGWDKSAYALTKGAFVERVLAELEDQARSRTPNRIR